MITLIIAIGTFVLGIIVGMLIIFYELFKDDGIEWKKRKIKGAEEWIIKKRECF